MPTGSWQLILQLVLRGVGRRARLTFPDADPRLSGRFLEPGITGRIARRDAANPGLDQAGIELLVLDGTHDQRNIPLPSATRRTAQRLAGKLFGEGILRLPATRPGPPPFPAAFVARGDLDAEELDLMFTNPEPIAAKRHAPSNERCGA